MTETIIIVVLVSFNMCLQMIHDRTIKRMKVQHRDEIKRTYERGYNKGCEDKDKLNEMFHVKQK